MGYNESDILGYGIYFGPGDFSDNCPCLATMSWMPLLCCVVSARLLLILSLSLQVCLCQR